MQVRTRKVLHRRPCLDDGPRRRRWRFIFDALAKMEPMLPLIDEGQTVLLAALLRSAESC